LDSSDRVLHQGIRRQVFSTCPSNHAVAQFRLALRAWNDVRAKNVHGAWNDARAQSVHGVWNDARARNVHGAWNDARAHFHLALRAKNDAQAQIHLALGAKHQVQVSALYICQRQNHLPNCDVVALKVLFSLHYDPNPNAKASGIILNQRRLVIFDDRLVKGSGGKF